MTLLDLDKLCPGVPDGDWAGLLWMIETCSAATALNKHKGTPAVLPLLGRAGEARRLTDGTGETAEDHAEARADHGDGDMKRLLASIRGKTFAALRDEAIIRFFDNTGARWSEVGNASLIDLDMNTESVLLHGKGAWASRSRSSVLSP